MKSEKYEKAIKFFDVTECLLLDGEKYNGFYRKAAFCHYKIGKYEIAINDMLKHIGKSVEKNDYIILSILYHRIGKAEESNNYLKREEESFPHNSVKDINYTKDKYLEKLFII